MASGLSREARKGETRSPANEAAGLDFRAGAAASGAAIVAARVAVSQYVCSKRNRNPITLREISTKPRVVTP